VLQSGRNGGFGAGNNYGIRAGLPDGSAPDFVYILNSDAFPAQGAIRALLDHLQSHPQTGFAGSYIHGTDGAPHRTAFRFPSIASEFESHVRFGPISRLLRRYIVAQPIPTTTTRVDWLAGASLMMRQSVLKQIGLFDETFFLYFEETDLCRRAALAGWPTDFVLESRVAHIGSVSTGLKEWTRIPGFWLDSRLHYFTKNHGAAYAALATLAAVAGGVLWRLRRLIQRKDKGDPPHYLRDMVAHGLAAMFRPIFGVMTGQTKIRPAK
jgi:GT2 family glycosyltransferase